MNMNKLQPVEFAKALADDTRQKIMGLVCCKWLSVNEIVEQLNVTQPTVSHHLAILREAGLVQAREEGKQTFYMLNQERLVTCCNTLVLNFAPETEAARAVKMIKVIIELKISGTPDASKCVPTILTKYIDNHLYKEKKMTTQTPTPTHKAVQEYYGKTAREAGSCCGSSTSSSKIQNNLYPAELLSSLPAEVANFTAGSGDPISLAKLKPGETVLDLGSGGGLDCFLAAKQVGESGRVIGVDMTPEMLERARTNQARLNVRNVEFREGFLESLPVDDNSIDVIISNCVINLSPDKPQVFREMIRVLKPGGRIAVSDMVANHTLPDKSQNTGEDWCGCTAGALTDKEYAQELSEAGFVDIHIEPNIEVVSKAIESGQVRMPQEITKEKVFEDIRKWE